MMKKRLSLFLAFALFFGIENNRAQGTFTKIYNIFQTKCTGACHGGTSPSGNLNLSGTETDVYNAIINKNCVNPEAQQMGLKRVRPGYPHRSFLLKKINNYLDSDNTLTSVAFGNNMPPYPNAPLSPYEIDLIASWIIHGAPQSGTVVNDQLISDFHNGLGLSQLPAPPAPDTSEGFQVHLGSIFLAPNEEVEYFLKQQINYPDTMEVERIESFIDIQSHHFLIYKFDTPNDAAAVGEGLRKVNGIQNAFTNGTTLVAAWQNSSDIDLPEGTAYFWEGDASFDLDLHIRNYSADLILKANVYSNIYIRKKQPQTVEMISKLIFYQDPPAPCSYPVFNGNCSSCFLNDFCIPNNSQDKTFTDPIKASGSNDTYYTWLVSSHAHKYARDFDVYLRNPDGTKGSQIYEGFYNFDYTFNQGYYDYQDPPVRYFEPALPVQAKDGFIQEATYNNYGSTGVTFGITTADEMMAVFLQYTTEIPTVGISKNGYSKNYGLSVFPNPSSGESTIYFQLNQAGKVKIEITDMLGKMVFAFEEKNFDEGNQKLLFNANSHGLLPGIYFLNLDVSGTKHTSKMMVY